MKKIIIGMINVIAILLLCVVVCVADEHTLVIKGAQFSEQQIRFAKDYVNDYLSYIQDEENEDFFCLNEENITDGKLLTVYVYDDDGVDVEIQQRGCVSLWEGNRLVNSIGFRFDKEAELGELNDLNSAIWPTYDGIDAYYKELKTPVNRYSDIGVCYLVEYQGDLYAINKNRTINLTRTVEVTSADDQWSIQNKTDLIKQIELAEVQTEVTFEELMPNYGSADSLRIVHVSTPKELIFQLKEDKERYIEITCSTARGQEMLLELEDEKRTGLIIGTPFTVFPINRYDHVEEKVKYYVPICTRNRVGQMFFCWESLYLRTTQSTGAVIDELNYLIENYQSMGTVYLVSREECLFAINENTVINLSQLALGLPMDGENKIDNPQQIIDEIKALYDEKIEFVHYEQIYQKGAFEVAVEDVQQMLNEPKEEIVNTGSEDEEVEHSEQEVSEDRSNDEENDNKKTRRPQRWSVGGIVLFMLIGVGVMVWRKKH